MTKLRHLLIFVVIAALASLASAKNATPVAAARSFYAYDRTHSQTFTRSAIDGRRKWFSAELYQLFLNELRREAREYKKHPHDKPYFADGLPFQPYDETCKIRGKAVHKRLAIKPDGEDAGVATVRAIFAFPPGCKEPDDTVYTLQLIRSRGVWVISNVIYSEDTNLIQDLKLAGKE